MSEIGVFDENNDLVASVKINTNLDYWDGRNWTCGSTGRHKGLTKLSDGRYVLIHTTQWQGERAHAEIITNKQALSEIYNSGNLDLLKDPKFEDLNKINLLSEEE